MKRYFDNNPTSMLAVLFGLWWMLNMFTAAYTELSADETYYWFISQKLDWGYFDQPPFFALFAHLGVAFLGATDLGVRLLTTIALPLALFLFWWIVRGDKPNSKRALIYFMISFSVPMLHLYGFVLTPDAPLLLAAVVTMLAFKLFCQGRLWGVLLLGVGFALLCYAKYYGALMVLLLIASRPKILIDWRFYVSCIVALVLVSPHLYWQYEHDWVSMGNYFEGSQTTSSWGHVWEYICNFLLTFNPLIAIPFVILLLKKRKPTTDAVCRALRFVFWGFFLFFLFFASRDHVQPQWIIVAVLPMLYFVTQASFHSPRFTRYVRRTSMVMGGVLLALHVFVMANTGDVFRNTDIFNNRSKIEAMADQFDGVDMIITSGNGHSASKFNYYGQIASYAMPNIYGRSSHYEFLDMETPLYGHRVAVEIGDNGRKDVPVDTLMARHRWVEMPQGEKFFFDIVESYVPTRKVVVSFETFPEKVLTGSRVALLVRLYNPYDFDIDLGGKSGFDIVLNLARTDESIDIPLSFKAQVLGAKGSVSITTTVTIPVVQTGIFRVGCTLQRYPYNSCYNSKVYRLGVINPKTRV